MHCTISLTLVFGLHPAGTISSNAVFFSRPELPEENNVEAGRDKNVAESVTKQDLMPDISPRSTFEQDWDDALPLDHTRRGPCQISLTSTTA